MSSGKPRILFLSVNCYPPLSPEGFVNAKLVLAMLREGWHVDVLTRNNTKSAMYPAGDEKLWVPVAAVARFPACLRKPSEPKNPERMRRMVHHVGRVLANVSWIMSAAAMGRKMVRRHKYDAILSRSIPLSAHLAARAIAKKARVPWIANWNDPEPWAKFPPPYAGGESAPISRMWTIALKRICRSVDWCTFPSERLRQYMCSYLPGDIQAKSSVIPHISLEVDSPPSADESQEFVLTHAGRLEDERNPFTFLAGVAKFLELREHRPKIKIRFIGGYDDSVENVIAELGLSGVVETLPGKPYGETQQLLRESSALLIIEAPVEEGIFLPSKLVDYAQTGRPILSLSPRRGAIPELLQEYRAGLAVDHSSSEDVAVAIGEMYDAWESGEIQARFESSGLTNVFGPDSIIRQYRDLLALLHERSESAQPRTAATSPEFSAK